MKGTRQLGNSCNFKDSIREPGHTEYSAFSSSLPVIADIEKKDIFQIVQLSLKAQLSAQPSFITYVPVRIQYVRPCTHTEIDFLICFNLSSQHCWGSALHFTEITCQSKHTFTMYSWCLIVYARFICRDIEPVKLNIWEVLSNPTDPYKLRFLPWIKWPWGKCCDLSDPPADLPHHHHRRV